VVVEGGAAFEFAVVSVGLVVVVVIIVVVVVFVVVVKL